MNVQSVKGYVLVILSGLVILAAALLVILQWGNPAEFSLYGKNYSISKQEDGGATGGVNTALLMLCSAAGGLLLFWTAKVMIRGIGALRRGRKEAGRAPSAAPSGRPGEKNT